MAHEDGVRRHLAERFEEPGFRVRRWDKGRVAVEHVPGAGTEDKPLEWRRQVEERRLSEYAAHLEQTGYAVVIDLIGRRVIVANQTTRETRN